MAALQTMVEAAKTVEHEVNQIVSISMSNQFRRNPVGGSGAGGSNAGSTGRTFLAAQSQQQSQNVTPGRSVVGGSFSSASSPSSYASVLWPREQGMSSLETFALTMLSNAEKALRESSNTNMPVPFCLPCDQWTDAGDHVGNAPLKGLCWCPIQGRLPVPRYPRLGIRE